MLHTEGLNIVFGNSRNGIIPSTGYGSMCLPSESEMEMFH